MKLERPLPVTLACVALLLAATTAAATPVRIEPRIMLTAQQRDRLQAVANEGADALRWYLWRTRMIYGWTWRDLVSGE